VSRIVVFGAGGRAGRRIVAEAVARGHAVTAVVRRPSHHQELEGTDVAMIGGDVTDAESVAHAAAGHDAAVNAAAVVGSGASEFFVAAAKALLDGLGSAGVDRLVSIGVGTMLERAPGLAVHDDAGFPADWRAFSLAHAAGVEILVAAETPVDWVVVVPPPVVLDETAARTGRYRSGDRRLLPTATDIPPFSYADLAVAVVDEVDSARHHRGVVAVGY
jgi:uncharacterized protein